jgi:hypothetical protein
MGLIIVFRGDNRTSFFPSLAKEGWRAAPGWFGMSTSQAERLYLGSNVGSRRLTQEHRCVDLVKADRIEFLQGRYPYSEA